MTNGRQFLRSRPAKSAIMGEGVGPVICYLRREGIGADTRDGLIVEFYARENRKQQCAYVPTSMPTAARMVKRIGT